MTIVLSILLFGLFIFVHELGHFLVAKAFKIRVNEFSLGMGPTLVGFGKGETRYSLRLFPIGGFVMLEGEEEESEDERSFGKQSVWKRAAVLVAGACMNLILGLIVVAIMLIATQSYLGSTTVALFDEGAHSSAMLQVDDKILKVNGASVHVDNDIIMQMLRDQDGKVDLLVERDGEKVALEQVPFLMQEQEDGTKGLWIDFKVYAREKTFLNVLHDTFYTTVSIARTVWVSLLDLITGRYGVSQLSGPVGVTSVIGQASAMGLRPLLNIIAFITINLGVFNLLPLPALDGGKLLFVLIEAVRGKPVDPKYENYIHTAGFLLLIGLMLFVTYNDIYRLITGG